MLSAQIPIIFLDIDGVLNNQLFYERRSQESRETKRELGANIDGRSVSFLNTLIKETGAKVVISSTWRHSGLEHCKKHLEAKGFVGEIIDITPSLMGSGCLRGNEIYHWIQDNSEMLCGSRVGSDYKRYVIFDDDSDMLLWQQYNYIKVDPYAGLSPNNCYKAKYILCPDLKFGE